MDWRINAAWKIFELMMKQGGYIQEEEEETN
jgi:pentatricopeptide repeat protein